MTHYVELHARSAFNFLRGASLPEYLVEACASLGQPGIALLDRDGVYGAPRFHLAAKDSGVRAHIGAEITLDKGLVLPVLVKNRTGYQNLCRLITRTKMRSEKGKGAARIDEIEEFAEGLVCLAGFDNGILSDVLQIEKTESERRLEWLVAAFGKDNVYVELQRHYDRFEEAHNHVLVDLAQRLCLPVLATNGVCFDTPARRELFDVLTCIREHVTIFKAGRLLSTNAERYLKTGEQMETLFADLPEAIHNTVELSSRLTFRLDDLGYQFPRYPVPEGETMDSFLRKRTYEGASLRYTGVNSPTLDRARPQLDRELKLIEKLGLAGYFLIVWDLINFCREQNILVQGRGSAANSAVCYSLRITAVDPIGMELLFERFLSEERGEWPDIDLDLPSGDRRERVIQYVYQRYGARGAAMTANCITYRDKSAFREIGKVFGFDEATLKRLSKYTSNFEWHDPEDTTERRVSKAELDPNDRLIRKFMELYAGIKDLPRHLGQHSGGMIICNDALDSIVPIEPASMPGRTVVQWDKDDCAAMGLIKIDLLGLGMMAVLQDSISIIRDSYSKDVDLAHLPQDDPKVYSALQRADTVGWFQVESRAQMSSLPRVHPERFYDIVVQVALIRPGPVTGQMVHPYIQRRQGRAEPEYFHPLLEPVLRRTLGVPLFQEQLLRMSMVCAGFTGGQAEELRRALGSKRSAARMLEIEAKLRRGMTENGITREIQDKIVLSITSFAKYGFPESHAASFALIAYASGYLKCHYIAAFTAAMLNNYPLGFYNPATLVKDAQRHGLHFRPVDVAHSDWLCTIEDVDKAKWVRLGLRYVARLREEAGRAMMLERARRPFISIDDLCQRVPELRRPEIRTLAEIGALNSIEGEGSDRRTALWQVESALRSPGELFRGIANAKRDMPLSPMTDLERLTTDLGKTSINLGRHPMTYLREEMETLGITLARDLPGLRNGQWAKTAGLVTIRQRPGTAKGFMFMSLEDETGVSNIIVKPDFFRKYERELVDHPIIIVEGVLQNLDNATSIKAAKVIPVECDFGSSRSRDFH